MPPHRLPTRRPARKNSPRAVRDFAVASETLRPFLTYLSSFQTVKHERNRSEKADNKDNRRIETAK